MGLNVWVGVCTLRGLDGWMCGSGVHIEVWELSEGEEGGLDVWIRGCGLKDLDG